MATVRRNAAGKYFVSIVCEIETLPPAAGDIGIDLGLKELVVHSDGLYIGNLKAYCKIEQKLARWQHRLSRRKKGGRQLTESQTLSRLNA